MANKYEDSLRWEQDGMSWLGFTDGALFCHVFCAPGDGWEVQNHFAEDETEEFHSGFITTEQAKNFGEKLYQEWLEKVEAHANKLELMLDYEFLQNLLNSGPVFDDLGEDDE